MATILEQYLIEDQLFRDDECEMADEVNEPGDVPNKTNSNKIDGNTAEMLENFVQQEVKSVMSHESEESPNLDENQMVGDNSDDQQPTTLEASESKSHRKTKSKGSQTEQKCRQCGSGNLLDASRNLPEVRNRDSIDVDVVVLGLNHDTLEEVERGTTSILLCSRKRRGQDASPPIEKKRYRMNLNYDEYGIEQSPSPPPMTFKSRGSRHMPKRIEHGRGDELDYDQFSDTCETIRPYYEQRHPFYEPHSRNNYPDGPSNQRGAELRSFIYRLN